MRKPVLLGSVVWCAVVAVVAIAVWQAIDAAGEDAFGTSNGTVPTLTSPTATSDTPPRSSTRTPSGTPTLSGTPSSVPSTPVPSTRASGESRSWTGGAGTVVVRCDGTSASLSSMTPADGYRGEIDKRGPQEVRVEFMRGEQEVRVEARCEGGVPRFDVEDRGGDSSGPG